MAVTPAQMDAWRAHKGRTRRQESVLDTDVMRRFAVATGQSPAVEESLPLLVHWAFFLEASESSQLSEDGHPLRGDFLPPVSLPRRVFGAASLQFEHPLRLAERAECTTTIGDVTHRSGQGGDLVLIGLDREIRQADRVCVIEKQTIIYRHAGAASLPRSEISHDPSHRSFWLPQPVELFRFSAVTFNAHRIHYDLPYAQSIEGYPTLVVHGPLTAVRLLSFAAGVERRPVRSFAFKMIAPLFLGQPVRFVAAEEPGSFLAVRCDGITSMTASVEFQ